MDWLPKVTSKKITSSPWKRTISPVGIQASVTDSPLTGFPFGGRHVGQATRPLTNSFAKAGDVATSRFQAVCKESFPLTRRLAKRDRDASAPSQGARRGWHRYHY